MVSTFGLPHQEAQSKVISKGKHLKALTLRIETYPAAINTSPVSQPESLTDVNVNQLTHLRFGLTAEALRQPLVVSTFGLPHQEAQRKVTLY